MSPQHDDTNRPTRQRSNTAFVFNWRIGRTDAVSTPALPAAPLPLEALIEALTPPAVPSLSHARALSSALSGRTLRLAILNPVLASLCSVDSPPSLQAAGYDILAAYWESSGSAVFTTADRLSCLSLFLDPVPHWSQELWEPRYRALKALIDSGAGTLGIEGSLLKVIRSWLQAAFDGLTNREIFSAEERAERQRSVETLTALLTTLVGEAQFVSRLTAEDTAGVLHLWERLIDQALLVPVDYLPLGPQPLSPINEPSSSTAISPQRGSLINRRHHSSTSLPQFLSTKHPADLAVDAYLTYLTKRLKALAPTHLRALLPLLFRSLGFYSSPLPRVSLTPMSPRESPIEKRITETLDTLVAGPFSSSCTNLLKRHLFPFPDASQASIQSATGAARTLRLSIRRLLTNRLARALITRMSSISYSPAGVPTHINLERDLMERAWSKDEAISWDLIRFRGVLCRAVKAWVAVDQDTSYGTLGAPKEAVLGEIAGILKDTMQAYDQRGEGEDVDDEEINALGDVLQELIAYFRTNPDGSLLTISLAQTDESSPFLSGISTLLAQDLTTTPLYPILPSLLISMSAHLADAEIAQLLLVMSERQCLSPTYLGWLDHWSNILAMPKLYSPSRQLTRQVAMDVLQSVWDFVRTIPDYRRPLAALVIRMWKQQMSDELTDSTVSIIWRILGDEVVLRSAEDQQSNAEEHTGPLEDVTEDVLAFLINVAFEKHEDDEDTASIKMVDNHSPSPQGQSQFPPVTAAIASPVMSRMQSDYQSGAKTAEPSMPSVMSLLSSFTSGNSSRSQSQPRPAQDQSPLPDSPPLSTEHAPMPKAVGAVEALVSVFSQLAFTPLVVSERNLGLAVRLFRVLVDLLTGAKCVRARLAALQFLMRLRVDRDHRLYHASTDHDKDGHITTLAALINRAPNVSGANGESGSDQDLRKARPRVPQERNGRKPSRGRGHPVKLDASRSRSRAATRAIPAAVFVPRAKTRPPMWSAPETSPSSLADADTPSEFITSYDPSGPKDRVTLPLSLYLRALVEIISSEKEWEILSYVLCHLPTQMSNKHLFCGPKAQAAIAHLQSVLCSGILEEKLATAVEAWPDGIIARDAHGLAYHTLTVLISYKYCFKDVQMQHRLVEAFLEGLNGQPLTIKCCLHALSLSAVELQLSMTKFLSRILEKLSQIMSNPAMAAHIIDFLAIVGSIHDLHANFTEGDYKMVFGVALQYLQHHNRPEESLSISWALSQHVRIMSYYIVYLWFLAVDLVDRPRHVKFITRQLLLANEGQDGVDEPAEVCFDWLARYTYASADPRPARSALHDLVMNPLPPRPGSEPALAEKTWISGNSVITVRVLARQGWLEVVTRRPSGLTKFLCRAENVPMVPLGDVDPDILSVTAGLVMDRRRPSQGDAAAEYEFQIEELRDSSVRPGETAPRPDPITGYVWSGSAPSQRRKEVAIDPGYFGLQLSSFPHGSKPAGVRLVTDSNRVSAFFRSLDRMPVIDTHKVGIMYVAPGQKNEADILRNSHGSPAYNRFLERLGRLISLRGQVDVYAGGLDPDEDGEYAYAWWDDIGQILFHTATLMPSSDDEHCMNKKRHIGNDYVRIIWNDSGTPYRFDTLATQFQFVNIVVEPHSRGAIAAFSNNYHENEYFKIIVQRAPGMTEFTPIGDFKLISAENLPLLVRQLSLLADWFVSVFQHTQNDTVRVEVTTNWRSRLQAIKRFRSQVAGSDKSETVDGVGGQELQEDFTTLF
ncbi:hypothetical protein B0H21DRAFT_690049 [Amylocystis lapponica]|nr:hypothetical protein B0H21DRAFT_690049 [Amylocystis lapponica]